MVARSRGWRQRLQIRWIWPTVISGIQPLQKASDTIFVPFFPADPSLQTILPPTFDQSPEAFRLA